MKFNFKGIGLMAALLAYNSFGADPLVKAKDAFGNSAKVKAEIQRLEKAGYPEADEPEAVVVGGGCGFAGCDHSVLVVQRQSTKGANTFTTSVQALVNVPAIGRAEVTAIVNVASQNAIELPWTMSSDSVQATVKAALYDAMKAGTYQERIQGDYKQVSVEDKHSRLSCQEQALGHLPVQQFRCVLEKK